MSILICPVCREPLHPGDKTALCENGHSFDRAKEGYFNLLQSQSSSRKRHGDDRLMLSSRRQFLSAGHYDFLLDGIAVLLQKYLPRGKAAILDVGCGEGYYTEGLYRLLSSSGYQPVFTAIDISKDAARMTAKRQFPHETAAASAYALPIADESCDAVINIFSPAAEKEFDRVLKPDGILVRAVPRERHLWGLKAQIYDKPYLNPPAARALGGFSPLDRLDLDRLLRLSCQEDIDALFRMTPYYYKTSAENQAKAKALRELDTELSFAVLADRKK